MGVGITGMHTRRWRPRISRWTRGAGRERVDTPWLATTVTLFTTGTLVVTLLLTRFDARTTFLRGMTDTLERLVRLRTVELERALHRYEQTTAMLQRTRENMATEIDERKAQARLEQEKDEQRRLLHVLEETHATAAVGKARVDRSARGRCRARDQQSDRLRQCEPQHVEDMGA